MTKTKAQLRAERNPFYAVADRLGVNCADRTDDAIAAKMLQQLNWRWMELPEDSDGQPVRWDEAVYIDYGGTDVFAKVFGICAHNRIAVYIPGETPDHRFQSLNAHHVREVDYVEN